MTNDFEREFEGLLGGYFDQTLDEQQFDRFTQMLRSDEALVQRFIQAAQLSQMIETELTFQAQAQQPGSTLESKPAEAAEVFAELLRMERSAQSLVIDPNDQKPEQADEADDPGSLSAHAFAAAGSYLLRHALLSRPAILAYAAAIILLIGVLLVPWGGSEEPTPDPIASDSPNTPRGSTVATLTATHNAQWSSQPGGDHRPSTLRPGTQLTVGQRLTLTQGFAEITTARGAVAIIEAPATIELLENNNAIRLHAGKLVGICETDNSQGFLVRTPHMDIIDLGTRFGVAVEEQGNTLAQVFEGKVVATSYVQRSGETATVELSRGESRVVDASGHIADRDLFPAEAFAAVPRADSGVAVLFGEADLAPRPIADSDTAAAQKGRVTLYQELRGHRLASDTPLTFASPGQHNDFKETRSSVPAGTVIRTYILWHPSSGKENLTRGSVTFEGEILGAVANERDWQAFVDATPSAAEQVCPSGRHAGLESVPADSQKPNEQFTLSDDRKTLQFQFRSGPTDALRVIVREPVAEQP